MTLFSDAEKREARLRSESSRATTEFTNLYRLNFSRLDGTPLLDRDCRYERRELLSALEDSLSAKNWFIDRLRFGRLTAHHRGNHLPIDKEIAGIILFVPAYSLQFHYYFGRFYLSIDYTLEVRNARTLAALLREVRADRFERLSAVAQQAGWQRGRLLSIGQESSRVFFQRPSKKYSLKTSEYIPSCLHDFYSSY